MTKPRYFEYFPNIKYALFANKAGKTTGIEIKDYFNLLKVRDDIYKEDTLYSPYNIRNGQRPDQISYDYYGDEQFYWVILQVNNIVDYWQDWPLSEDELTEFCYKKYGQKGAYSTKQWETIETFDNSEPANLILPGGRVVPEDFIFYYPSTPGSAVTLSSRPESISFYQYERRINDRKSQIYLLDKKYIWDYETEVRNYGRNLGERESFVDISMAIRPSY